MNLMVQDKMECMLTFSITHYQVVSWAEIDQGPIWARSTVYLLQSMEPIGIQVIKKVAMNILCQKLYKICVYKSKDY